MVKITQILSNDLGIPNYSLQDTNLLTSLDVSTFLSQSSYIEAYIYQANTLISSNYNFTTYSITNDGKSAGNGGKISQINLDTEKYLQDQYLDNGEVTICYNFLNKKIGSSIEPLFISEISSDRTEIRLDSTSLTDLDIIEKTTQFVNERELSNIFIDFYLNFGNNNLFIANNIKLENLLSNPTILVKLYEPLPNSYNLKDNLWVVTDVISSTSFLSTPIYEPALFSDSIKLKGPNFNLDLKDQVNNSSLESSYADLITTSLTSSQNQLNSLLEEKEIDINIDYTNFNNFIHFSSVQTRLENFYYKVSLIEQYSSSIAILNSTNSSSIAVGETSTVLENKIDNIITNFDGYDYYLYYSSGSWAWPKLNPEPPYQLAITTDPIVLNWFGSSDEINPYYGGINLSASNYDLNNKDYLYYTIPEYLRDDSNNSQYELFIDMVAQHFDNIWVYYKDVTEKFDADNRLESGISKDIVADAIRDFGIKLYQNNFSNEDLFTAFLGLTPEGGLFPFPNITGSLPTPSGYEYVDTLISASNDYLPLDDVNKSLYKRIYHNLPYLLKAKGTIPGLRALITSYGIPDTILRINEYGGKDKVEKNDWDYWQNEFNYTFYTSASNYVTSSWGLNTDWGSINNVPGAVMFRFKLDTPDPLLGSPNQILFSDSQIKQELSISYTGSGYTSGSYSGSIADPYYQYATLTFTPDTSYPTSTASVYLPFYNEGWWSVLLNASTDIDNPSNTTFNLYASNKIYEGGDNGTLLGFIASSSILDSSGLWSGFNDVYFGYTTTGSLQEIRYYTNPISESVFKDYVMNPYSIEGNSLNSGPNELAFRASLGGELYTGLTSIHPKVTGSWIPTSSFVGNSNFSFAAEKSTFIPNTEYFFYDQPVIGIQNAVSDKIRLEDNIVPQGDTLSAYRRIVQNSEVSASYTPATNLLEVAFSPQDEINDDISSQIGYFNIGDFIGDPAFRSSQLTSYPDLDTLRNSYFEKYTKNYNLFDYIRLIKFFDNSLFKMIKDFVPARTSLASGIVVKQHLLERNRYPQPQMSWSDLDISGTLKPQWNDYEPGTVEHFEGGAAGMFNPFNGVETSPYGLEGNGPTNRFGITQSWYETYPTISGSVTILHDNQDEFFNGEFSGSTIVVTTQSLNQAYPLENAILNYKHVYYFATGSNEQNEFQNNFLNLNTIPYPGEILFLNVLKTQKPWKQTFSANTTVNEYYTSHIKVAKIDCNGNDNSIPLGQATKLLIFNPPLNQYVEYNILVANETNDYYLYESTFYPWIIIEQIGDYGNPKDAQLFNYYVSSSITSPYILNFGTPQIIDSWNTSLGNLAHYGTPYFNTASGIFTFENTPNTPIQISASIFTDGNDTTPVSRIISLMRSRNGSTTKIPQAGYTPLGPDSTNLSATIYPIQGDQYYIEITKATSGFITTIVSASLYTSQERNDFWLDTFYAAPLTSSCSSVILEPYITTVNYYNSDNNPLINNAVDIRKSYTYQDIDYSQGALVPVNFDLLISGSAQKAEVQDSNYTLARHINPRYNGSKTTSQFVNVWTPQDDNTYGNLPTIETNKTYVAYCDTIGGYTPDRNNSSGIVVRYLIDENGTVSIPNTSENSLANIQDTFLTGERLEINTNSIGSGVTNYRNIIKGGYRIGNILYNQSGSMPGGSFVSTITLTDNNETGGAVSNFQASLAYQPGFLPTQPPNTYFPMEMSLIMSSGSAITSPSFLTYDGTVPTQRYTITAGMVTEGISLKFKANINAVNVDITSGVITAQFMKLPSTVVGSPVSVNVGGLGSTGIIDLTYDLPFGSFEAGDQYIIVIKANLTSGYWGYNIATWDIFQTPIENTSISTTGLWISSSGGVGTNTLYSTESSLVSLYGTSNIFQQDIPNSGFEKISLPWNLKTGDEFRFGGREDRVFMVNKAYVTTSASVSILAVDFNKPLPSSSLTDYNQFAIRRYVEDAGVIIFEGLKPGNAAGPYIVRPEFVSLPLRKGIDAFIVDLTQKGLLP